MSIIRPWRVLASRTIVSDRWLSIRADACETASGDRIDPYYVIDAPDWAAAVAVTRTRHLVLVRQYRHPIGRATLEFPAGAIDPGEDASTAAARELAEEAGYRGVVRRLAPPKFASPARFSNQMHTVLIEDAEPTAIRHHDASEETEVVLWPVDQAMELLQHPDFCHAAQCGALVLALGSTWQAPPDHT